MDLQDSISWSSRDCRSAGFVVEVDEVSASTVVEDAWEEEGDAVDTGVLPSFLAFTKAFTNSLFSKNVFVDIPYDSSSCLMAPARMDLISVSKSASSVL